MKAKSCFPWEFLWEQVEKKTVILFYGQKTWYRNYMQSFKITVPFVCNFLSLLSWRFAYIRVIRFLAKNAQLSPIFFARYHGSKSWYHNFMISVFFQKIQTHLIFFCAEQTQETFPHEHVFFLFWPGKKIASCRRFFATFCNTLISPTNMFFCPGYQVSLYILRFPFFFKKYNPNCFSFFLNKAKKPSYASSSIFLLTSKEKVRAITIFGPNCINCIKISKLQR